MKCLAYVLLILNVTAKSQSTSSQIIQELKKLNVLGSVLYIAAHPDDENTRLIAYLANDRLYRTGYLSLTRGDGGQNLLGDEQGVELGLIRTQELLSARRIDGGEQFFSRAYDFGYSKNAEETFTKWNKQKLLADVVWVIRSFKPDVIVTRFPTTGEGGHGHHTASAILANEAFKAAADANQFKEQLKYVKPWQAQRILFNGFNFGGVNTTKGSQLKIDVGGYNPLLGKNYGEIAAQSRSQHKSQGFGSAATRGEVFEYFTVTGGDAPKIDLLDGVDKSWNRVGKGGALYQKSITDLIKNFDVAYPQKSVPALVALYQMLSKANNNYWISKKKEEVQQLIASCSGMFIEAYSSLPYAVQTSDVNINVTINNRLGIAATIKSISIDKETTAINNPLEPNKNFSFSKKIPVSLTKEITQPYWLKENMVDDLFVVNDQQLISVPDVQPTYIADINVNIAGQDFIFQKVVQYKYTDPVKGEVYQPLIVVPPFTLTASPNLLIFNSADNRTQNVQLQLHAFANLNGNITLGLTGVDYSGEQTNSLNMANGNTTIFNFKVTDNHKPEEVYSVTPYAIKKEIKDSMGYSLALKSIAYDHIPTVRYFYTDFVNVLNIDLKTVGKKIGYIPGAGDKVATVLERMGYAVTILDKATLPVSNLSNFDAIITGVRAYNTNEWLAGYYDALMNYVKEGGNLIVQYNTHNNSAVAKPKIGPYPFNITRNRITDETAKVKILDSLHRLFNFPNKITDRDFDNWVQERSIYHADGWDANFKPLISMADPGEEADEGSLITTKYGKGNFTYTGLVFFRELPAGVPGAMRLLANLIALNKEE